MSLGYRIKKLRQEKGLTQSQLGACFNLAESTISLYESEKRSPDYNILRRLSLFFNVSVDYLLGYTELRLPSVLAKDGMPAYTTECTHGPSCVNVPVVTGIRYASGTVTYEKTGLQECASGLDLEENNYYYFLANENCMSGDSIFRGDLLLIRETPQVNPGDICLVATDNSDACLCRFFKRENHYILQFSNPNCPPRIYPHNQSPSNLKIVGKIVELKRKMGSN